MADITMCQNKQCPMRLNCYRFTAKATPQWQSYSPFRPTGKKCKMFWDAKKLMKGKTI